MKLSLSKVCITDVRDLPKRQNVLDNEGVKK